MNTTKHKHQILIIGAGHCMATLALVASLAAHADPIGLPASVLANPNSIPDAPLKPGATDVGQVRPSGLPPLPSVQNLSQKEVREGQKKDAYDQLVDQLTPLTPEQVIELRSRLDKLQRAKSTSPYTPPKAVVSSIQVRGDPGEAPPVIRLSKNFITTLVFTDVTGAPWPIVNFGAGGEKVFDVKNPDAKNAQNVLTVSPLQTYAYGNIQVILQGRPAPILLTLASEQKEVDYQTNLTIQARGPNALAPVLGNSGSVFNSNPAMTSFLDGVAPAKSTVLSPTDPRVQAWTMNSKTYVRTRLTLFSPAWTDHQASPDGMHAYEINSVSALVLGDGSGQTVQVNLNESSYKESMNHE